MFKKNLSIIIIIMIQETDSISAAILSFLSRRKRDSRFDSIKGAL